MRKYTIPLLSALALGLALALAVVLLTPRPARGAVPSTTSRVEYTASGATGTFTFSFPAYFSSWIEVYVGGVKRTSGVTVTLNANQATSPGGTVVVSPWPAAADVVRIQRRTARTQDLTISPGQAFPASSVTRTLDRQAMVTQELDRDVQEAMSVATTAQASASAAQSAATNASGAAGLAAASAASSAAAVSQGAVGGNATLITPTGHSSPSSLAALFAREVWVTNFAGVDPTGAASSTAGFNLAIALANSTGAALRVPKGTYRIDAGQLSQISAGVFRGEGPDSTIFDVYGAGTTIRWNGGNGGELSGFTIRAKNAGISGVVVNGANRSMVHRIRVLDADGFCLRVGQCGLAGVYTTSVASVECNNAARCGDTGIIIDGGCVTSSNQNQLSLCHVKGQWATHYDIRGNANVLLSDDAEPDNSACTIREVIRFRGSGNEMRRTYLEPVGLTKPEVYVRFDSGANANLVANVYSSSGGADWDPRIADSGAGNEAWVSQILDNFTPGYGRQVSYTNLVPNSAFNLVRTTDGSPVGWATFDAVAGTTVTRETESDGTYSIKMDVTDAFRGYDIYLATHQPVVRKTLGTPPPIGFWKGRSVSCTVKAKSVTAGCGNLKLAGAGTTVVKGTGAWERLAISTRISESATELPFQFRTDVSSAARTCTVWFKEPICTVGNEVPLYTPKPLFDSDARLTGRLVWNQKMVFSAASTTPSVADGNLFDPVNLATITNFLGGIDGQEIKLLPSGGATTLKNNATILTTTGADKALTVGQVYRLLLDGTVWREF